ncbi:syntaxin-16-like [Liolophura sinensis]|uniref:syntaxin-16-like n=1 Tax=Liolophura sinensis TaxID=3198878 RepID=UPI003158B330
MATRSLTEVYILMRNNALQSRNIFSEQMADDRMALVSSSSHDPELGMSSAKAKLPPEWVDGVEEFQYEVSRIKDKMKELATLHDKHLNRPTLDDSVDEEHAIEIQTQDITQLFGRCQRLVHQIGSKSRLGTEQEKKLSLNITSSLARGLTEMSTNFRKSQSSYLRKLQSREERSKQYFDTNIGSEASVMSEEVNLLDNGFDRGFTDIQLQMVEDNTLMVHNREKEIAQIVKSINDLNEIFKDLGSMIVDQGTILDRIDYNIEHATTTVEKGLQQLQKAEKYQKKNRKMFIILILFVVVIILIIILIATRG